MSTDYIEHHDAEAEGAAELRSGVDLRRILNSISEQIVSLDRRQSDALVQMEDRLVTLSGETRSLRLRVPAEFRSAFEHVENALAELADRLGGAVAHRTFTTEAAAPDTPPAPTTAAAVPPSGGEVNPPHATGTSASGDTAQPWSSGAADALADLYESGEATFDPVYQSERGAQRRAQPAKASDWLEARFGEIANRIEHSLSQYTPDHSFTALSRHFERFEERLGTALRDVASRSDFESLSAVKTDINELASQIENAQTKLSRLDQIESQLRNVADKLSDERLASLLDGGGRSDAELEALITAAAEKVAAQIASLQPAAAADANGIDDVRQLLEAFIVERRQSEETSAQTLDALQHAMIGLLDRMDAFETMPVRPAIEVQSQPTAVASPDDEVVPESFPTTEVLDDERRVFGKAGEVSITRASFEAATTRQAESSRPADRRPQPVADVASVAARIIDRRQDFIADAKRAKLKAEAAEAEAEANVTIRRSVPRADAAKTAGKTESSSTIFGIPKRRLLISALAVLLLIPSALMLRAQFSGDTADLAGAPQEPVTEAATAEPGQPRELPPPASRAAASAVDAPLLNEGSAEPDSNPPDTAAVEPAPIEAAPGVAVPPEDMGSANMFGMPGPRADAAEADGEVPLDGIAMHQPDHELTADELDGLEQQLYMASVSQSLGEFAAWARAAALIRDPGVIGTVPPADLSFSDALSSSEPVLDLPPATVGPLSLRLAAAKGDPSAEFEVGARLAEGKGTDQNFKEAARWYQRSASRGFVQAQYRLGTLYERGLGMKADVNRARTWYKRAAERGNVKAMHNLAVLSAGQSAGSPDYATAVHWFTEAAERGLADSQFNLAVLYENGLGVQKDMAQALTWVSIASRSGDREALRRRDELKSMMEPSDISVAERGSASWRVKPTDPLANDARIAGEAWKRRRPDETSS